MAVWTSTLVALLSVFHLCVDVAESAAAVSSCVGGDWYIEDTSNNKQFYRCYNGRFFATAIPCGTGTCVPSGFGSRENQAPCMEHCYNPGSGGSPTPTPGGTPTSPGGITPGSTGTIALPVADATDTFTCTFEVDNCNINYEEQKPGGIYYDYIFKRDYGPTITRNTGPNVDHTVGTDQGYYMVVDASNGPSDAQAASTFGKTTQSMLPTTFSGKAPLMLSFWYHMYGKDIYYLNVKIHGITSGLKQTVWSKKDDQGQAWLKADVQLPGGISGGYHVLFEAVHGLGIEGDIAVDDISVTAGVPIAAAGCDELWDAGNIVDGWYYLALPIGNIQVRCELDFQKTVIGLRSDGSVSFDRPWAEYKAGFGSPLSEYWIGLEAIRYLSNLKNYNLDIVMDTQDGNQYYATYSSFKISDEASEYALTLGPLISSAAGTGDALRDPGTVNYGSNGMRFTTKDNDNDMDATGNCAEEYKSGWWFNACWGANLNGLYTTSTTCTGTCMGWRTIGAGNVAIKRSVMSLLKA